MKTIKPNFILSVSVVALSVFFVLGSWRAEALGGISGSKLVAPCTDTVPRGLMEFEPYFSVGIAKKGFNGDFGRYSLGLEARTVETGFRYTIGLLDSLEVGLITPFIFARNLVDDAPDLEAAGLGDIPLGLKWRFWETEPVALALQAGVTVPSGYANDDGEEDKLALGDGATVPEIGLISTLEPVDSLTIDLSLVGGMAFPIDDSDNAWLAGFDIALGYAFGPLQPVVEINQTMGGWSSLDEYLLSANIGFTYELDAPVVIVTGVGIDLIGKNVDRGWSYNLVITILL